MMALGEMAIGAAQAGLSLAQAAGGAGRAVTVNSIWDFCVKGGPVMIPIGLCSLVALAVIVERLVSLRRSKVIPASFLPGLTAALAGADGRARALEYCNASGNPLARIFATGLRRLGESTELLEKHIQDAGEREVMKLRRYLRLLAVIASISTLLGLLGTIFGMINAFQTVAASGEALGKTELLARGIYEALITTAAGLIVSIPTLIAYHGFAARIDSLVLEMDVLTVDFLETHAAPPKQMRAADVRPKSEVGMKNSENGPMAELVA